MCGFNIIIYVLCLWWGMYWWNNLNDWTFELFGFLAAYSTLVFVVASLLYPTEFPHDMDFDAYFYKNQGWFFGLLFASYVIDVPETYWKSVEQLREVPAPYVVFLPTILVIVVSRRLSRSSRSAGRTVLVSLMLQLAYVNLSVLQAHRRALAAFQQIAQLWRFRPHPCRRRWRPAGRRDRRCRADSPDPSSTTAMFRSATRTRR